jgi:Fe-S-cluster containining protein
MSWLPVKTAEEHDAALEHLNCPHLGERGCEVYDDRPLICRLFGTTPRLACPNGHRPEVMIDPRIEQKLHQFFSTTRQVLV